MEEARLDDLEILKTGAQSYLQFLQTIVGSSENQFTGNPFKELCEYQLCDAPFFYGRAQALATFLPLLNRSRLTVLHSQSGAGKTSLIRAGIFPRLITQNCLPVYLKPHDQNPVRGIKTVFAPNLDPAGYLAKISLHAFFYYLGKVLPTTTIYIFLDQFEEFFTWVNPQERMKFISELAECLEDETLRVRWVIALRAESFSALATLQPHLSNPFNNQYYLCQLSCEEARQAIQEPLKQNGKTLEEGLLKCILTDLEKDKEIAPPQLQLVCSRLYNKLEKEEQTITLRLYEQEGRAEGILRNYLDEVLHRDLPASSRPAAHLLLEALVSSEQKRVMRTQNELQAELARQGVSKTTVDQLLEQLTTSRLLRLEERDDGVSYELVHDYLLAEIHLNSETVSRKAAQELLEREVWAFRNRGTLLSRQHLAFINAYVSQMQLPEGAEELIRKSQEEIDCKARAEKRRARIITTVAIAAAVIMSILGWFATTNANRASELLGVSNIKATSLASEVIVRQTAEANAVADRNQVQEQNKVILSRQLASQSRNLRDTSYDLALLLSLQAYQISGTAEARAAMFEGLEFNPWLTTFLLRGSDANMVTAFSPNGNLAAVGDCLEQTVEHCNKYRINVWNLVTRKKLINTAYFNSRAGIDGFTPDGQSLVLVINSADDNYFIFWNILQGKEVRRFAHNADLVAFSADGKLMASAGFDGKVILWDMDTGQPVGKPMIGHSRFPLSVAFHPSGELLATGGEDGVVLLWNIKSQELVGRPMNANTGPVEGLEFNQTGNLLVAGTSVNTPTLGQIGNSYLVVWDTATQQMVHKQQISTGRALFDIDPTGQIIVYPDGDKISFLDTRTWTLLATTPKGLASSIMNQVQMNPDGHTLFSSSASGDVVMWDLASDQRLASLLDLKPGNWVYEGVFTPDGKLYITGTGDGSISIWDISAHALKKAIPNAHPDGVFALAISPDGKTLASGGADKTVALWNLETGELIGKRMTDHKNVVRSVSFNADGTRLASGATQNDNVLIWDVSSHQVIENIPIDELSSKIVSRLRFSPVRNLLAICGTSNNLILWDADSHKKQLYRYSEADSLGTCVDLAFSPDDSSIAIAEPLTNRSVYLINLKDGKVNQSLAMPSAGIITHLSYSPDGKTLAAGLCTDFSNGCTRGGLALWDTLTGKSLGWQFSDFLGSVSTVTFDPIRPLLGMGTKNGQVLLWDLDVNSWQARICQIANRNLSLLEWNQYIGDGQLYQRTCPDLPSGEGAPVNASSLGEAGKPALSFEQNWLQGQALLGQNRTNTSNPNAATVAAPKHAAAADQNSTPVSKGGWQAGEPELPAGLENVFSSFIQCREAADSDTYLQQFLGFWAIRNTRQQWVSGEGGVILTNAAGKEVGSYPVSFSLGANEVGWIASNDNSKSLAMQNPESTKTSINLNVGQLEWKEAGAQAANYDFTIEPIAHHVYGSEKYPQHSFTFQVKNNASYPMTWMSIFGVIQNADGTAQDLVKTTNKISLDPGEDAYMILWSGSKTGRCVNPMGKGSQSLHYWIDFYTEDEQLVTRYGTTAVK